MFLVGLTGGVATGKSTVGKMFLELGVPVIDADLMARKIVEPGRPAWKKIRAVIAGSNICDGDLIAFNLKLLKCVRYKIDADMQLFG